MVNLMPTIADILLQFIKFYFEIFLRWKMNDLMLLQTCVLVMLPAYDRKYTATVFSLVDFPLPLFYFYLTPNSYQLNSFTSFINS